MEGNVVLGKVVTGRLVLGIGVTGIDVVGKGVIGNFVVGIVVIGIDVVGNVDVADDSSITLVSLCCDETCAISVTSTSTKAVVRTFVAVPAIAFCSVSTVLDVVAVDVDVVRVVVVVAVVDIDAAVTVADVRGWGEGSKIISSP